MSTFWGPKTSIIVMWREIKVWEAETPGVEATK